MIKLSLRNFIVFLKGHTLTFILIVSGLVTTIIGVLFIFGYEYEIFMYNRSFSKVTETMTLSLNNSVQTDELIDLVKFFMDSGGQNFPIVEFLTTTYKNLSRQYIVAECFSTAEPNYYINGSYFEQHSNMENEIILSENYMSSLDSKIRHEIFGKEIQFDGNSFIVIGSCRGRNKYDGYGQGVFIPLQTYIRLGYPLQYLDIAFLKPLSSDEEKYLHQAISAKDFIDDIRMPDSVDVEGLSTLYLAVGKHLLLLSVSLVALLKLLSHWLQSNWPRFRVYLICGSTYKDIMFIIAINNLLLSIISCSIAWPVYLIVQPVLLRYNIVSKYPWYFTLGICAVITAISFMYSLIIGIRFLKKQSLSNLLVAL